jgi:RNA polymerase sigma-70 factor, ECF subfamily
MEPVYAIKLHMVETDSDEIWVRQAKAGDLSAFEALVSRHEGRVYSLAQRMLRQEQDAEDVVQQTFLSALEHLAGFREESSFATWLARIATHAALKIIRRRQSRDATATVSLEQNTEPQPGYDTIPHPEYIADWRQSPHKLLEQKELRQTIEGALETLDEKHRLVFLLRDVEGLSVRDTAQTLGLSEANVKVRLLRARLQLREKLTTAFGDPARRLVGGHTHEAGAAAVS